MCTDTHLYYLPLLKGQLLIGTIRVGGHGDGVVVEQRHENPRQVVWLRFLVIIGGSAITATVAICNIRVRPPDHLAMLSHQGAPENVMLITADRGKGYPADVQRRLFQQIEVLI